jgi:hypothetical protein
MTGTMVRDGVATQEQPMLTMSRSGQVKREFFRPLFEGRGSMGEGQTFPYARGTLVYSGNRPRDGGGIYLSQGTSLRRIWCANEGNAFDRQCRLVNLSISPSGCHAAFFAKDSDDPKARYAYGPTLKILPLCP